MILSDIKKYIQQRGQVSLEDIALHFDTEPDAIREMLKIWIRKGKIIQQKTAASCGSSCNQCDSASTEIYTWTNNQVKVKFI